MAVTPGIYMIDGRFGAGKTLSMARRIVQLSESPNNIIFTNILMHVDARNIKRFDDFIEVGYDEKKQRPILKSSLLDVLEWIGQIDEEQRNHNLERAKRLKFYIFFDEGGIIFNQHSRESFPSEFYDYLLQSRKIFVTLFFGAQIYQNLTKQLRQHVNTVFYTRPLFGLSWFKGKITEIRCRLVDIEGNPVMEKYSAKDLQGNTIVKERPIERFVEYVQNSYRFKYYDDLFLNKKFVNTKTYLDYTQLEDPINFYIQKNQQSQKNKIILLPHQEKQKKFTRKKISDIKQNENSLDLF